MTLTSPGAISNSGSKPFSNLYGRIAMDNYNIILESQSVWEFYTNDEKNKKNKKNISNKCKKFKPKNVNEVIKSTGLI